MAAPVAQNPFLAQLLSVGFNSMQTKTGEALALTYQLEMDREFLLGIVQFLTTDGGKIPTFATNSEHSLDVALSNRHWIIIKGEYVSISKDPPIGQEVPPEDVSDEMTDYYTGCLVDQPIRCQMGHVLEQSRFTLSQDGQNEWVNVSPNCPHTSNGLHRIADNHHVGALAIDRGVRTAAALFRRMDGYRRHLGTATVDLQLARADLQTARAALNTSIAMANAANAQLTIVLRERNEAQAALQQTNDTALFDKLKAHHQLFFPEGFRVDHATKSANIAVQAASAVAQTGAGKKLAEKSLEKAAEFAVKKWGEKVAEEAAKKVTEEFAKKLAEDAAKEGLKETVKRTGSLLANTFFRA